VLIKEATYKKVRVTQTREVTPDIYGCDECSEEIKQFPNEENRLEVKVFHKDGKVTGDLHFCSWECVINHLP
jgi:hypothetical protein